MATVFGPEEGGHEAGAAVRVRPVVTCADGDEYGTAGKFVGLGVEHEGLDLRVVPHTC